MTDALFAPPETFMRLPPGSPGPGCRAAILGVPFDCGTHPFRVGARQGPASVRQQSGLIRRYHPSLADADVPALLGAVDCGDVALTPAAPTPPSPPSRPPPAASSTPAPCRSASAA